MLNTYLTFDGNCREAFEFYRSVFGGEFLTLMTFGDAPPGVPVSEADRERVMHVALPVGSSILMGSDTPAAGSDTPVGSVPPLVAGNNFGISIDVESRARCDETFAKLSAGGAVEMPLEDQFWGAYFGQWRDRFGIRWMVSHTPPQDPPQD